LEIWNDELAGMSRLDDLRHELRLVVERLVVLNQAIRGGPDEEISPV